MDKKRYFLLNLFLQELNFIINLLTGCNADFRRAVTWGYKYFRDNHLLLEA